VPQQPEIAHRCLAGAQPAREAGLHEASTRLEISLEDALEHEILDLLAGYGARHGVRAQSSIIGARLS
jgi:hypothetical protein